jgi:hypothetical protein
LNSPFNEYYIVAYIAQLLETLHGSSNGSKGKVSQYFETYMGTTGEPKGLDGYPVHIDYHGHSILTDNNGGR